MSKSNPSSVTAEEKAVVKEAVVDAVAKMVNMDYIPDGFTLEEMLSAFTEEAEVDYENAQIDRLPKAHIESLRTRLKICKARETLALMLLKDVPNPRNLLSITSSVRLNDITDKPRSMYELIADWVSGKYGIAIPEWTTLQAKQSTSTDRPIDITWENIEIRIRKDNKIAFSHTKGKWIEKTLDEVSLLDRKKKAPNHHAGILIGLSHGNKFPKHRRLEAKDKTAISKLRSSLKTLTGIESEPFTKFNESDGWKPRFKVTDTRSNAEKRAEKAALHEQYDDGRNYEDEDDAAGKLLRGE